MGRWGEKFFEGDTDLDVVEYISRDAGIELYRYQIHADNPSGQGLQATRNHLDNGVLDHLFRQYSTQQTFHHGMVSRELSLVFLAVLAMRVGATISPANINLLRTSYQNIRVSPKFSMPMADSGFRGPMKLQFEIALAHYQNNGNSYDFEAPRCALAGCDKAADELPQGQNLLRCGKCKVTVYCNTECQAAHWKKHKKVCKTPEQREEEMRRPGPGGFMSLKV